MNQPDFAPLHEASSNELLLNQQGLAELAGATKSICSDCDYSMMVQPDFSPLFVPAASALEPSIGYKRASFASLVERVKFLG